MYTRKLYSVSFDNLNSVMDRFPSLYPRKSKTAIGIQINDSSINEDLYNQFAQATVPYILIIEVKDKTIDKNLSASDIGFVNDIMPLLMNHMQFQYFFKKVILIKIVGGSTEKLDGWHNLLLEKLGVLGIRNVSISYDVQNSGIFKPVVAKEIPANNSDPSLTINWQVSMMGTADDLPDYLLTLSNKQVNDSEDIVLQLREENALLKGSNDTLLKNIYDLNNYYRFVRGETTFKYHNREEEKKSENTIVEISHQKMSIEEIKKYYNKAYDRLPSWYKRVGTVLKIILLRRELLFYVSKKHKNMFLDIVYSLPDEKQLRTWYYYEYEVLPGWYKRLGKML